MHIYYIILCIDTVLYYAYILYYTTYGCTSKPNNKHGNIAKKAPKKLGIPMSKFPNRSWLSWYDAIKGPKVEATAATVPIYMCRYVFIYIEKG